MKTARIDVAKADARGLGVDETVTLVLTGRIKGLETYDMITISGPEGSDKPEKKEPPKITVNLDIEIVKVEKVKKQATTTKQAFDDAYEKEAKASKDK